MKKLFLLLAFLLAGFNDAFISHSFSKSISGDSIMPLPKVNKEFLVVAHIVKSKDGSANLSPSQISIVLQEASTYFEPIGVSFTLCQTDYIDNFQYDSLYAKGSLENLTIDYMKEVFAQYNVKNRINMYFMTEFLEAYAPYCAFATLGGLTDTRFDRGIFLKKGCNTPSTIAHELGHYLGLLHTFDSKTGKQIVNDKNCSENGDKVCDTPADPFTEDSPGSYYDKDKCQFIYTQKDINGDFYDPDLGNIMSYYGGCKCSGFTNGQLRKMAYQYLNYIKSNPDISISW